jgi:hypothetical protein
VYSASVNLVLYYVGFGYVLLLVWAALLSDVVATRRSPRIRGWVTALRVLGLAHPAAALGAWDLRRELQRSPDDHTTPPTGLPLDVAASFLIATAVIILTRT